MPRISGVNVLPRIAGNSSASTAQVDAAPPSSSPFRLTRHFLITILVGVLVILGVLLLFYRHFAIRALEQHETRANIAITRVFASTLWPRHALYVSSATSMAKAELRHRPEVVQLREDVLRQMAGLSVVKVKIYNLDGLTAFSTDPNQIGEDKSTNSGFLAAKGGRIASEITFRDRFDAFEGVINDRDLISSYIPIRTGPGEPVEGVMEVYSDVTDYVAEIERTKWEIMVVILGSLSVLYLFLFMIVRRANHIIRSQSEEVRVANAATLRHQSLHDALTGLPNRASLAERLDGMIKTAKRAGEKCAVLCLDVNGIKDINASLGHAAGDEFLKEVSRRLQACLREADVTARIEGNEFVVALSGISAIRGVEHIVNAAEKIREAVGNWTVAIGEHQLAVTINIGVAICPDDGSDAAELIKSADAALHHAKKIGRNNYQFHTADMNVRALELLLMERDLRQAMAEKQFVMHYQPQMDLKTGRITGAEALIRWRHPERGLVLPAQFIHFAEERDLIIPIGEWALREACRQNMEWQAAGLPAITVAVNLSALQFHKASLARDVADILQDCGLAPAHLALELTESAILRDAEKTIETLQTLKDIGVGLALDDFGTGYSSLSQVKRLPFDKLKIDQTFVRGLPDDTDDLAISSAVVAMGKALQLTVNAEGVETAAQRDILQSLGCDEIQGFFISAPVAGVEFGCFLREHG